MACRLYYLILIAGLSGCASVPKPAAVSPSAQTVLAPPGPNLATHSVHKGETLWRISKIYHVDLEEIASLNKIPDATRLTVGQTLYIPGRPRGATETTVSKLPASHAADEDFAWPAKGKVIAYFRETNGGVRNKGIDIAIDTGGTVVASRSGRVVFAGDLAGYGPTLIIDHRDGLSSIYCGISEFLVKVADDVPKGTTIARSGMNVRTSSGRLHFEIRRRHRPQNPLFFLS